jgi:hypothetical protein
LHGIKIRKYHKIVGTAFLNHNFDYTLIWVQFVTIKVAIEKYRKNSVFFVCTIHVVCLFKMTCNPKTTCTITDPCDSHFRECWQLYGGINLAEEIFMKWLLKKVSRMLIRPDINFSVKEIF